MTTHDLAMVNFMMEVPAVDVFVCSFPWDRVVDECHKVLTVRERREAGFAFLLVGLSLERSLGEKS